MLEHKYPPPWGSQHEPPTEPVTESATDAVVRRGKQFRDWSARLKMELLAFALFVCGVLAAVEPDVFVALVPPKYQGYVIAATAIAVYVVRRYVKGPPEPIIRGKR